jgi:meiotically up-regulated gene 157 (Mug157) protein
MGMSTQETGIQPSINNGLIISIVLIALLVFMELTDPAYGNIRKKILSLRQRYGTLSASLLLIFFGIVMTKVVMIIAG